MKKCVVFVIAVLFLASCKSTETQESVWAKAGAAIPKEFGTGNGLLIIQPLPIKLNNKMQPLSDQALMRSFSLKNVETGEITTIKHNYFTRFSVNQLIAGRYCLNSIKAYTLIKYDCSAPYFDVSADSIEYGGIISIGIHYNAQSAIVTQRILGVERPITVLSNESLTASTNQKINDFYQKISGGKYPFVFYLHSLLGRNIVIRFYEDGTAEVQQYAQNQPTYNFGSWHKSEDEFVVSIYKGNLQYRLKEIEGKVLGMVTNKFISQNPGGSMEESWLVVGSRNIQDINLNKTLAGYPHQVIAPGIPYPKLAVLRNETGTIDISFNLQATTRKLNSVIYEPTNINILSTTLNNELAEVITNRFKKYRYLIPKEFQDNSKYTETITLKIKDNIPSIEFEDGLKQVFTRIK